LELGLNGKRVLVAGGTKSIGHAIADAFVAEGANVGFCARDAALVNQREQEWRAKHCQAHGTALDVTDDPALKAWIDGFANDGGLDHFVYTISAAGVENSDESWRKSVEIDIVSTVNAIKHARPHLEKSGLGATLTVIGSTALAEVSGPVMPYRSVKAALVPLVKALAIELAAKGVRANIVSPGTIVETGNIWGRMRDAGAEIYKRTVARNPMGRLGTPQEVAATVVFLAGAPASFVTGVNLIVDGALTARVQY
jgi:3-oxoacyl-[acyl-carrier protein] reductase